MMNSNIEKFNIQESPIKTIDQDALGRGQLIRNIVELIKKRSIETNACYTIGIYGEWGEGKSSVLNLICSEIEKIEKILIIRYNPWFFQDNESLILDFFRSLRVKKISADFTKKIKRYAPFVSFGISNIANILMPGVGNAIKGVSDSFIGAIPDLDVNVVDLKEKINESIEKSGKHLLIVIDDVDRLDKDEIHALFKLIKQNADFVNTTYLIGMDVEMVAKSIANRFEDGSIISGRRFIEKIVQVPIQLPKIQQGHIFKLSSNIINKNIEKLYSSGTGISTQSLSDVQSKLEGYIFPIFVNIREINNYNNSLSVLLPLVYREIYISDLCMLEALKIFHPEAYILIRDNKHFITGTELRISHKYIKETDSENNSRKNEFLIKLVKDVPQNRLAYIELIIREVLGPFISSDNNKIQTNSAKRLCSSLYFDKFFLYTNPEELISNSESDDFFESLSEIKEDELISKLEYFYKQYGYEELKRIINEALHMKHYYNINNESIGKLCISLSKTSFTQQNYNKKDSDPIVPLHIYISHLIEDYINIKDNHIVIDRIVSDNSKKFEIFKSIIEKKPIQTFHIYFAAYFYSISINNNQYKDDIKKIGYQLVKEYYQENKNDFFELNHRILNILLGLWKQVDEDEYNNIIADSIFKTGFNIESLINKLISPSDPDTFERFAYLFDVRRVYETITATKYSRERRRSGPVNKFISFYKEHDALTANHSPNQSTS